MPRLTKTMTARATLAFLLIIALAAGMLATISGDEGTEERTLPTISISATGGTTAVTEGGNVSFTVTADSAPTTDTEVWISIFTSGKFTDLPEPGTDEYLLSSDKIKIVTIAAGTNQMEKAIPTIDDGVDEEDGYVIGSMIPRPGYTLGTTSQLIQVQDNDPTAAPEKMAPPTVLPTNEGLEIFWEEPAHTGEREITGYSIIWLSASDGGLVTTDGDHRHHTVSGLTNGEEYTVQIRACKAHIYCSPDSDDVTATPTSSGPTITGPGATILPEEAEGAVGQYSASSEASTTWRLGGDDAQFFSQTADSSGDMTLTLNAGTNFEEREDRGGDNIFEVTVVATDSSSDQASSATEVTVTVTDVDETPAFDPDSLVKGPYQVGEPIPTLLLPTPKADESPITYVTTGLPPGLTRFGTRGVSGVPTQAGTYTATHTATDTDGDSGSLTIEFAITAQALQFLDIPFTPPTLYLHGQDTVELPEASGGTGTVDYSLTNPPTGMTFDPSTRELSGTPTEADTFSMTYTAEDDAATIITLMIDIEVKAQLLPPTGLDLKPAPSRSLGEPHTAERSALLTWEHSRNALRRTTYKIYAKYPSDPATSTKIGTAKTTSKLKFPLDNPDARGKSLLTEKSLTIWIIAEEEEKEGEEKEKANSVASEAIVIEDTSIISINGNNKDLPETATTGKATVKWSRPNNVTSYSVRWKELGADGEDKPHTDLEWKMDETSVPPEFDGTDNITNPTQTTYEIQNLDLNRLYGVQLNYTRSTPDGVERVFGARDFHVYPSRDAADGGERIASAPLWNQLPTKEYLYAICTGTFPGDPALWRAYIEHALEQWEIATDGLIKMTPALDDIGGHQECADYGDHAHDIARDVALYVLRRESGGTSAEDEEILARTVDDVTKFLQSANNARLVSKARAIDPGVSEVLTIRDPIVGGMTLANVLLDIAGVIGRRPCIDLKTFTAPPACANTYIPPNGNHELRTDLLFSRNRLISEAPNISESHFPGGDRTPERGDVKFNSCEGAHPIYPALVHEAGHALGITARPEPSDDDNYVKPEYGHFNSAIAESALSYGAQHTCFPHPLDIAVIYAIYQTK